MPRATNAVVDPRANRVMLPRAMRALPLSLLLVTLTAACDAAYEAPLSYGRCSGDQSCGLGTGCQPLTASTSNAPAGLCTLPCSTDANCPGVEGVCVTGVAVTIDSDGGALGRCMRSCNEDADCRPGTVCRAGVGTSVAPKLCVANLSM